MNAPPDRDTSTLLQTGNELFLAVFLDDAVRIVKAQLTCFAQVFNAFVMLARVEKDQPAVVVSFREIGIEGYGLRIVVHGLLVFLACSVDVGAVVENVGIGRVQL